jgi:glycine betaine/proline transport system ATP-binding protein
MSAVTDQETRTEAPATDAALSVSNLWKIFGRGADRIIGTPDADLSRADLKEKTGCVVGVKDVSFDVAPARSSSSWASPAPGSPRWSAA